jgi:hypothetical protein
VLPEIFNAANRMRTAPVDLEPFLDDQTVSAHPHLAVRRACRLMESGDRDQALRWFGNWRRSQGIKPWPERLAAARTIVLLAHRQLDRLQTVRETVHSLLDSVQDEQVALPEDVERHVVQALTTLDKAAKLVSKLYDVASSAIPAHQQGLENAERLVLLLPLAIRLDTQEGEVAGVEMVDLQRSATLAEQVRDTLEQRPTHAGAWAMLAAYQAFMGEDAAFAEKQAQHFGGGELFATTLERLRGDGLFDQG